MLGLSGWRQIMLTILIQGHDTNVAVSGAYARQLLEPLLKDHEFMKKTLVMVAFDENRTGSAQNRVLAILLGGAVPEKLHGTTDSSYYTHCTSFISKGHISLIPGGASLPFTVITYFNH
jgi:acid phosphatase